MDANEIAKLVEARESKDADRARKEDERARRQVDRARAEGSRVQIVDEWNGSELRVAPRRFFAALRHADPSAALIVVPMFIPAIATLAVLADYAPDLLLSVGGAVFVVTLATLAIVLRWFIGASPLRVRLTSDGQAALWHRSLSARTPTWVGPTKGFRVHLDAFGTRNSRTGDREGRHGWTEIGFQLPYQPLRHAGSAYFLNVDDANTARAFFEEHGVLR